MNTRVLPIVFNIECGIVNKILRHRPISLNEVSLSHGCLFFDPHLTTRQITCTGSIKTSNRITPTYLTTQNTSTHSIRITVHIRPNHIIIYLYWCNIFYIYNVYIYIYILWSTLIPPRLREQVGTPRCVYASGWSDEVPTSLMIWWRQWVQDLLRDLNWETKIFFTRSIRLACKSACLGFRENQDRCSLLWHANLMSVAWP